MYIRSFSFFLFLHPPMSVAKKQQVDLNAAFSDLVRDVKSSVVLESLVCGKGVAMPPKQRVRKRGPSPRVVPSTNTMSFDTHARVADVVGACRAERKRREREEAPPEISDQELYKLTRFTDGMLLEPYAPFLHFVPRLVNIVRSYAHTTACRARAAFFLTLS